MPVVVREAVAEDLVALAGLRWRSERPGGGFHQQGAFERDFVSWWTRQGGRVRGVIALDGDDPVGMGYLALVGRIPSPADLDRLHGDIQTMYVVESHRGAGIGTRIVATLVALARDAGCSRVEVRSGRRAVAVYERAGFELEPLLLNLDLRR